MSKSIKKSQLLPITAIVIVVALSYIYYQLLSPNPVPVGINQITVSGTQRYVSPSGSDSNSGTESAPYKTLSKAVSQTKPGETLYIRGGVYREKLLVTTLASPEKPIYIHAYPNESVTIDGGTGSTQIERPVEITGSNINIHGLEVTNAGWACVVIAGTQNKFSGGKVHECYSHGIYTDTLGNIIENNTVYNTNLENKSKTKTSGWGSAIKLRVGAKDTLVKGNIVYNNYGEGVAATRAINTKIIDNFFYDNYYVNIYVDNSIDTVIKDNLTTCTSNLTYTKNNKRAVSIAIAEEFYEGWGNQLKNIIVENNIAAYCSHGITYWGADNGSGGLRNVTIKNNLFYSPTHSIISLASEPGANNTLISNNIFHAPSIAPWISSKSGITIANNYWIEKLPSVSTNALGTGDIAGSVTFTNTPPSYNNKNSYNIITSNPSFSSGQYGPSSTISTPSPTTTAIPSPSIITSPPATSKPGDLNKDGTVNLKDFNLLITKFGNPYTIIDFNQIITNFGK